MSHSNPATRHADNMIALELIVPAPAIPWKRYPLPLFKWAVVLGELADTDD